MNKTLTTVKRYKWISCGANKTTVFLLFFGKFHEVPVLIVALIAQDQKSNVSVFLSLHHLDVGVDYEPLIPNNFKASSWACMSPASFFKGIPDGKCHSAWCGPAPDSSNWLQIKVAFRPKVISHLASKGSNEGHMVTSFYLAYGTDGILWKNYTVGGERQVRAELLLWGSMPGTSGWGVTVSCANYNH